MDRIHQVTNQFLDGEITAKQYRSILVVQLSRIENDADTNKIASAFQWLFTDEDA